MTNWNIALGFYQNPATARTVLKKLRKEGFTRSASIEHNPDGKVIVDQLFLSSMLSKLSLAAITLCLLAFLFLFDLSVPLMAMLIGIVIFLIWTVITSKYIGNIDEKTLQKFKNKVIRDETLVIVQVLSEDVPQVLSILRHVESGHPISFLLRAERFQESREERLPKEPLTFDRLHEQAGQLAKTLKHVSLKNGHSQILLKRLSQCEQNLSMIRLEVTEAEHIEQTITLSAEWFLDNTHVIRGSIEDVRRNLPKKFYKELPKIAEVDQEGIPRAYVIASDIIASTASRLNRENVVTFLKGFQEVTPLTIGELWAIPLLLRLRLIEQVELLAVQIERRLREGEQASFWGNRLLNFYRREPENLPELLNDLAKEQPNPSPHFAEELLDHLFDEEAILPLVHEWLEKRLPAKISDVIQQEQKLKAMEQVAFSSAIVSLITLSQISWREVFESVSPVDAILGDDPTHKYLNMDFDTRDSYRHAIEKMALRCKKSESEVAEVVLQMAQKGTDEVSKHVGYYLIDDGRVKLERTIGYAPKLMERIRRGMQRRPALVYIGSVSLLTLFIELYLFHLTNEVNSQLERIIFLVLALLPASELSVQLVNLFLTQFFQPVMLPKMSFIKGIPEQYGTLVIVPMLLSNSEEIQEHIQKLEVDYLANADNTLRFGLFSDFLDAPQQTMSGDADLLKQIKQGIKDLDSAYGPGKFFLFHRQRSWNPQEQVWMGWERKRGKLENLNRYLMGESLSEEILSFGNREDLKGIRYVITLDSDTQLPKDKARHLVETLAHPLNTPRLSSQNKIERGYTIIQPRVSTSFMDSKRSYFSRIFADTIGIDPYVQTISDVYQDLAHCGTYHGKGIYEVAAFHRLLTDRFQEEQVLSHDLLEGAYVQVGFASDITLFDSFPKDYLSWTIRQHRWIRGDWQILGWLFPKVYNAARQKIANPISILDRWKIFDNVRRALMPIAIFSLLISAWIFSSIPLIWTSLVIIVLAMPFIALFISNCVFNPKILIASRNELITTFLRVLVLTAVLPYQAWCSLDALCRVIYRTAISHKHLLEWNHVKQMADGNGIFLFKLAAIIPVTLLLMAAVTLFNPPALVIALPFAILWMASPFIISILNTPISAEGEVKLSMADHAFIRRVGRKTWRYFDDFVGPQTHWLPPDNYQAALDVQIAQRTSPTNIGLWMLSALSAYDLKYITSDECIKRINETLQTVKKLERYEGHLLNWYDIQSLQPLFPRYVSTVDSGNLLACYWTLVQGIYQMLAAPLVTSHSLDGLQDAFDILYEEEIELSQKDKLLPLKKMFCGFHSDVTMIKRTLSFALTFIKELLSNQNHYWIQQIDKELQQWELLISRYFSWADILRESPQQLFSKKFMSARNRLLHLPSPSLQAIASGSCFTELNHILDNLLKEHDTFEIQEWYNKLKKEMESARWFASEQMAFAYQVIRDLHEQSDGTNLKFLYNQDRKVFSIGYHADDRKLDSSYYDLLASEARIASLVAIAKGEVPLEHWWSLARPYTWLNGRYVLCSWGGTMFEYLMPLLFNKQYQDSLLGNACKTSVDCQKAYGKKRGIPWGISEAAFSEIDARMTYQYRSFGVPGLGLKRGLEEDLVVSPYSSALALSVDPQAAIHNLKRLSKGTLNLLNMYGFYESVDFTRQHGPHGERGVIVYAYMAHHQGMTLVAIDNLLNDKTMCRRFQDDPRICGIESLLYEKVPLKPSLAKGFRREIPLSRLMPFSQMPIMGVMNTPQSATPKVDLLANGEYSIMVTNSGGGYSKWKDIDITRWRADTTCDSWGSFCYVKDVKRGLVWSVAFQPTHVRGKLYHVTFKADKVEFRRRDNEIEVMTEIVVSPEDNAEIRLMTFANLSSETRILELTSYSELVLAPHLADRAHPCFNKLFIETEAVKEFDALLAFRRKRSPEDASIWAAHIIAASQTVQESIEFETDRNKFIGRGRTLQHPAALDGSLSNSSGTVLDPIFSLRRKIVIQPGQRVQVSLITAVADTREKTVELIQKYRDIASSLRAVEMAWTHAQLELRHLRIHQEEAQLFQKLASRILYPHSQLRPSSESLKRNQLGQSHLWPYGISGDIPILVVTIADIHEIDLVKQALTAHAFLHLRGLKIDLVILNEESIGYESPLLEQLKRIVHMHAEHSEIEKPGGIFLRNADQIPEPDLTLLLSISRANLIAARGTLRQQLVSPMQAITYPPRLLINKRIQEEPSPPLPFMELPYFNGLGGYTSDGKEYVIYLSPNSHTPAPWINVIANPRFGTLVTEVGLGTTWYGNSQTNRLTPWSNDPVLNPIVDAIYIRDEETGNYWTATPAPIRELDAYRIHHGQGYSQFEHNSHGIEQLLTIFVPVDDSGGIPVRVQKLLLTNRSSKRRFLSITSYSEWVLGNDKEDSQVHIITEWDPEAQAIFAYNRYHPDFSQHIAFSYSQPIANSFTADRTEFIGRNSTAASPMALKRKSLSGLTGAALDPCAALQLQVELDPGEQKEVVFVLGYAKDAEEARQYIRLFQKQGYVEQTLANTQGWWDKLLASVSVTVPDLALNFSCNRWLLYQVLSCRLWGRTAFYQSSGAYGFRDQLQDVLALLYAAPHLAREHILRAAAHQFVEGDVQHWWHEPSNGGVRTRISDDLLWLPYATAQYVRITKDSSILDESVSFLKGPLLEPEQHELYFVPEISGESATLLEHCRRAIFKGLTSGSHGLPLMGSGDWNDGMNRVGMEGKGESVWLAWFLIQVMNDFADLLMAGNRTEGAEGWRTQCKRLADVVDSQAWDGEWYLRAYFDDGMALGSKENLEGYIDSIAQSWAVIAGAGHPDKVDLALKSVEKHLIKIEEGLVLLLTTPFDKTMLDPGYIKGYPPGVRENGGQYTHGSLWVPLAFARRGEGNKASTILNMMHPNAHTRNLEDVQHYKVEPYVLAGDVYSLQGHVGRGGWTWYTGAAGWLYRIWLEEILGFQLRGNVLTIRPTLPSEWERFQLRYLYQNSTYDIEVLNPSHLIRGRVTITLDGALLSGDEMILINDGLVHNVQIILSNGKF